MASPVVIAVRTSSTVNAHCIRRRSACRVKIKRAIVSLNVHQWSAC